jgi:G3E family GTPase
MRINSFVIVLHMHFQVVLASDGMQLACKCMLVGSNGISEPLPVAETFTFEDGDGNRLATGADLDTMVTVVDGGNFMNDFGSWDDLTDRRIGLSDDDGRNIVDLLVDQVEFANVIIINKTHLLSAFQLEQLMVLIDAPTTTAVSIPAVSSRRNDSGTMK